MGCIALKDKQVLNFVGLDKAVERWYALVDPDNLAPQGIDGKIKMRGAMSGADDDETTHTQVHIHELHPARNHHHGTLRHYTRIKLPRHHLIPDRRIHERIISFPSPPTLRAHRSTHWQ
jgi:hypothetical protein